MKAKCKNQKCLYEWESDSKMIKTSCPSCGSKVVLRESLEDLNDK